MEAAIPFALGLACTYIGFKNIIKLSLLIFVLGVSLYYLPPLIVACAFALILIEIL